MRLGLRLRFAGERPSAADSLGVSVHMMRWIGMAISGGLAGMGGAVLVLFSNRYLENQVAGRGFLGLATMIFGNWMPAGTAIGAGLFGYAQGITLRTGPGDLVRTLLLAAAIALFLLVIWMVVQKNFAPGRHGDRLRRGDAVGLLRRRVAEQPARVRHAVRRDADRRVDRSPTTPTARRGGHPLVQGDAVGRSRPSAVAMTITLDDARRLPKVLLHDHLDGGLRVAHRSWSSPTRSAGHCPRPIPTALQAWFTRGAETADLLQYLATFEHTLAVMQTAEHIERVAHEAVVDLAADGVVYAEVRFAPELHQQGGLELDAVVEAVTSGFRRGEADVAADGRSDRRITVNAILCAMRTEHRSVEIAHLVDRLRAWDDKVVAFDLAGAETGFPPSLHAEALAFARSAQLNITVHASEPPDLDLISDALAHGAHRIGHGVRLRSDTSLADDAATATTSWCSGRSHSTCSTTRSTSRWHRRATSRSVRCRASATIRSGRFCERGSTSATTPTTA